MNEHEAGLLADDLDEEMYFQVQCCGLDWLCHEIPILRELHSGHAVRYVPCSVPIHIRRYVAQQALHPPLICEYAGCAMVCAQTWRAAVLPGANASLRTEM
jgi:hypothetical protein